MSGFNRISLAGLAAAAALSGVGSGAMAQDFAHGNYYVKGFGGFSMPQENDISFDIGGAHLDGSPSYDTGYLLGAAVGYKYSDAISVELEYAYRNSGLKSVSGFTIDRDKLTSNAVMLNGYYAFDAFGATQAWRPYFGAGLGTVSTEYKIGNASGTDTFKNNSQLGYQVMVGVAYDLNPKWDLYGEARYFGTENKSLSGPGATSIEPDYHTADILFGAAYKF